jgi:hypothetical protein
MRIDMHGDEIGMKPMQRPHLGQGDRAIPTERDRHDAVCGDGADRHLDRGEGGFDLTRAHGRVTHVDDAKRGERVEVGANVVGAKQQRLLAYGRRAKPRADAVGMRAAIEGKADDRCLRARIRAAARHSHEARRGDEGWVGHGSCHGSRKRSILIGGLKLKPDRRFAQAQA